MRRSIILLGLLLGGCYVEAHPRPPPARLSPPEAVSIATQFARSHGLVVDYTESVWADRRARWHVVLTGAAGRDRALVVLDAFSGHVLHARLHGPRGEYMPPPPPGSAPEPASPEPTTSPPPPGEPPPPPPAPAG